MSILLIDHPAPRVARLTMNRPESRNKSGKDMRIALHNAFTEVMADPQVGAVILTGAGGHFSAGGDITEFGAFEVTEQLANVRGAQAMIRTVMQAQKPVIAAVEGYAAGAGVGYAAAADLVVGGPTSKFFLSFMKIGMVPDMGLTATLTHRMGLARARRAFMLAETIAAETAHETGLVDVYVGEGEVQARALEIAAQLAAGPAGAMASLKRGFYTVAGTIDATLEYEAAAMAVALTGKEVREGAAAFLEKRPPKFG